MGLAGPFTIVAGCINFSHDLLPLPRSSEDSPDPRQHPFRSGITLSARLWIPVAFRLAAFASWIILCPLGCCAFLTVGLLGAKQTMPPRPDSIGVATFRTDEIRPGRVSPLLRGRGVRSRTKTRPASLTAPTGVSGSGPLLSSWSATLRQPDLTKPQRRFTDVHPSGLPLAGNDVGGSPSLGVSSLLHTPPLPATRVGVGTGGGHSPESRLSPRPLIGCDLVSHATTTIT